VARSKKTEEQIRNKKAVKYAAVGDVSVEEKLQEIEFEASTLETIDRAFYKFIDEELNLFATSNDGFKKVPVLWVTAERAFQIKAWQNKEIRSLSEEDTLVFPLMTVNRATVVKDPTRKGTVWANLYPTKGARGGVITVARNINQKKTAEFQNAYAARSYGPDKNVAGKMKNTNKRNMSVQRVVYDSISMPIPTWIIVNYEVALRSEYQQQMNEMMTPFITIPGNSRTPKRITSEGHYYELFIDGNFNNASNAANIGMDHRNYENTINIEVLGYLIGAGENEDQPIIVKRENAVEFKLSKEKVIFGDIPETLKDGFYRE
jgi:hypothetical protein